MFKKFLPELVSFPLLLGVYLLTRLYNLMALPIFTDEAIYTRWAQIARFDSNWRFISLTDGKQPSFVWVEMIMMRFFDDPLMAGRVVSVIAGLFVIAGLYFLSLEVFKIHRYRRIIGIITIALGVFFPFSLVYDRMALYESMIAAFMVWALYFQILLVRNLRFDVAMVLGAVLGSAVLTKSSGFLGIYLMPFLLLLFDFRKKDRRVRLIKFAVYLLVVAFIASAMYAILRLSPFYHIIEQKNSVFVYPVSEWLKFTFPDKIHNFLSNSTRLIDWFLNYFTFPFALLVGIAFFTGIKYTKEKALLLLWFLLPFLSLCFFGKNIYPRYLLFMVLPLLPLVGYALFVLLDKFKNNFLRAALVIVIFFLPIRMMYYIIFDIARAPIPELDLEQLINGWPAGGGMKESIDFFKEKAKNGPIYVATQGTFGLTPAGYEIYFIGNNNLGVKGYWPTNETIPEEVLEISSEKPTYFVFYQECSLCEFPGDAPDSWPLRKIKSYSKGIGDTTLTVYEVIPREK